MCDYNNGVLTRMRQGAVYFFIILWYTTMQVYAKIFFIWAEK